MFFYISHSSSLIPIRIFAQEGRQSSNKFILRADGGEHLDDPQSLSLLMFPLK